MSVLDPIAVRREIDAVVAGQTVCSIFRNTVAKLPDAEAMKWKVGDAWQAKTWAQYADEVDACAAGLLAHGLQKGDFVNILMGNCPEHYVADVATLHAGGTPVTLYNTLAPDQIEYIVNHSEAKYLFVGDPELYARIAPIRDRIPGVRAIFLLQGAQDVSGDARIASFDDLLARGRAAGVAGRNDVAARTASVGPDDLATLIYTSGTTGPPKGVMVTHANVAWTTESLERVAPRHPGQRHISYLPLAHIAERMVGHYLHMKGASTCYFCPQPQQIAAYLADVRPEYFFAVPRIWEKMHTALNNALAALPDAGQRSFVELAIATGLEKVRLQQKGQPVPEELAKRAAELEPITALVRQRAGLDAVQIAVTGAAPISAEILEWFAAIGVNITEVYGQSEGSGPTSWNRPDNIRIGTVGQALPGVEVRLGPDGELLARGGNITKGYYKEPALTAETFDAEGWLASGDVAHIDAEGFIKIVDRKKEILITAGGKNIAPSNIESLLKQQPLIGQACVVADGRPFVSALIVLDSEAVLPWARAEGLPDDLEKLAAEPRVLERVQQAVDNINQHLNGVEQVKKFVVLPREWTVDTGELTPTLKMKRKVVYQRYADIVDRLYAGGRD